MRKKILLTILIMCLAYQNVAAQQEVKIESFTATTDHIPSADRKKDSNGVPCALVKVQVIDDIERVEGNKIGDIINKGVEKWIYMCKGSRNVRLHFKNHLPVKVTFRDFRINGLESNRVYELVINMPNLPSSSEQMEVKGNNMLMRVIPANAIITIWSDDNPRKIYRPENDGSLSIHLPYGRYYYKAKAEGYNDLDGSVFVSDHNDWENVILTPIMGILTISCPTPKTTFYLDGKPLEKNAKATLWTGQVVPGTHSVEVKRNGHYDQQKQVIVSPNQDTYLQFESLKTEAEVKKERKQAAKKEKQQKQQTDKEEEEPHLLVDNEQTVRQSAEKSVTRKVTAETPDNRAFVFGLRTGVNMASIALSSDAHGDSKMTASFHAGVNLDMRITNNLHLNTSLLYSQKGYKYEDGVYSSSMGYLNETATAHFLTLPIQLSYRIGMFQINCGPYIEYGLGGEIEYGSYSSRIDTFEHFDALNYGITVGVGRTLWKRFYLGVNYEMGMSDYANRNIAISLGYNF